MANNRLSDRGAARTPQAPSYGTLTQREGSWWQAVKNAYMLDTSIGQTTQFAATANAFGVPWASEMRRVQEGYNPYNDEDLTGFELYLEEFQDSTSPEETSMIKQIIESNIDMRQSLDGWGGTRLFAGLLDPINLIPVPFAIGKGFAQGAKTALQWGTPAIGATETVRHLLDPTSTVGETAFATLGGTLFMGLIGGGVGKIPKGTMTVTDALNKFVPPDGTTGMSLGVPITGTDSVVGKGGVAGVMKKIWRTMNSDVTMGGPAWKRVDPETVIVDIDDIADGFGEFRVFRKGTNEPILEAVATGKVIQVQNVRVPEGLRRQGLASYAIKQVANYAEDHNLRLVADQSMSDDAMKLWQSLDTEGYTIKENPNYVAREAPLSGRRSTDGKPLFEAVRAIDPDQKVIPIELREELAELEESARQYRADALVAKALVKELKEKVRNAPKAGGAKTKASRQLADALEQEAKAIEEAAIAGSVVQDKNVKVALLLDAKTVKDWDLLPTGYNKILGKFNQFPWWRLLRTDLRELAPDIAVKYQMFALKFASTPGLNNKGNALSATTGDAVESSALVHAGQWLAASRASRSMYRKFAGYGESSGEIKHFMVDQHQRVRATLNKYTDTEISETPSGVMSYRQWNEAISHSIASGGKHPVPEINAAAAGYVEAGANIGDQIKKYGISGVQQNIQKAIDDVDLRIKDFDERWGAKFDVEGDASKPAADLAEGEALVVDFRKNEAGAEEYFQKLRDNENLTPDEVDAIVRYNDNRGRLEIHENPELKALLESAAAKTVAEEDIVVYRGGTSENDPTLILKEDQFVPTTLSSSWAVVMGSELGVGDVFHRIVIKRGSKHLPMKNGDATEFEILLPPGTELEKVSVNAKQNEAFLGEEWGMTSGFGSENVKIVEWEVVPDRAILDEMDLSVAEQRASEVVNGIDEAAPTVNPKKPPMPPGVQSGRDRLLFEKMALEEQNAKYVEANHPEYIHRMWLADQVLEKEGILKDLLKREFSLNPIEGKFEISEGNWIDNADPDAIQARVNETYASILHEADTGNNSRFKPDDTDKRKWLEARKRAIQTGEYKTTGRVGEVQVALIDRKIKKITSKERVALEERLEQLKAQASSDRRAKLEIERIEKKLSDMPTADVGGSSGPLIKRRLDLDDVELLELGLIEADVDVWMQHYVHRTAPMIETARIFGDARAAKHMSELHEETIMRALEAGEAGNVDLRLKLEKEAEELYVAMRDLRDIVQGNYQISDNVDAITPRVLRMLRNFNILGAMGRSVFMALGDIGNVIMSQGFVRSLGHAAESFGSGIKDGNIAMIRKEVDLAGSVSEVILGQRYHQMTDFGIAVGSTKYPKMAKFERKLANASQRFFLYNLLGPWTDMARRFSGGMLQSRLIENSILWKAGKLSQDEQTIMGRLHINKPQAIQFADEWERSGSLKHGAMYIANTDEWISDQAVMTFRTGMNTEINRMVPTPGAVDKPKALLKGEWWKVIGQYRGFSIAATHRIMGAGLHQKGAQKYSGLASMVGIAMMVDALKRPDYIDMPIEEQLLRAVELSGVTGIVLDLNDTLERATAGSLGARPVFGMDIRERSPNWANRMGTLGAVPNQWLTLMYGLTADEAETDDLARAIRYMIPYNNLLWWNEAFNRAQRASVRAIETEDEGDNR